MCDWLSDLLIPIERGQVIVIGAAFIKEVGTLDLAPPREVTETRTLLKVQVETSEA